MRSKGPFPKSLGDHVAAWIERECCHGPGDVYGEPVRLTHEEHAFLDEVYTIDVEDGRRTVDLGVYSRRKGTRKSELGAWLCAAETMGPVRAYLDGGEPIARPPVDPWVLCAATTEDQGDLVYGAFRAIVKASPRLEQFFDVGLEVTHLIGKPGKVELRQSRNPGALDGGRPTFEVGDETHLWIEARLLEAFATLRRNLRKRHAAQPWMFLPTTAYAPGQESVAEVLHRAVASGTGKRKSGRILFDHRQAAQKWDLTDPTQLRLAIEQAGGDAFWSDTEAIAAEYESGTVHDFEFRRYWLNQPTAADGDNWLQQYPGAWGRCEADVEAPDEVLLGVDMALRHDSVGLTAVGRLPDGRKWWKSWIWDGDRIDHLEVFDWIRAARDREPWRINAVVYDPRFFELPARQLQEDGFAVIEFPQSPERMAPACEHAYQDIVSKQIVHDGDAGLAKHVNNAAWREGERGRTLSKKRSTGHIDALIAGVMANWMIDQPAAAAVVPMVAWR